MLATVKPARRYLHPADRHYLRKATKFVDHAWTFFSQIEDDFILLHMPMMPRLVIR